MLTPLHADTIFQTVRGEDASAPGGGTAADKKLTETKDIEGGAKVAHVVGSMNQWGYISFWFGQIVPAGKVVIRVNVYVDDTATAQYGVYADFKSGQALLKKLTIPADAKKGTIVAIDLPVDQPEEWNGVLLKKFDSSTNPSPWIDSVSVVVP
jgi:hypothetical protein